MALCTEAWSRAHFRVVVVQLPSRVQLFANPMDCSTLGFPVPHHIPEFAQVHVHWIGDTIQPSRPLSPSSSAFNLIQHQGLFQWVCCCISWPEFWARTANAQQWGIHQVLLPYYALLYFFVLFFTIFKEKNLNWGIVDLQCCVSFRHITMLFISICICVFMLKYVFIFIQMLFLYRLLSNIEYSSLCYIYNRSLLFICLIHSSIYMLLPDS